MHTLENLQGFVKFLGLHFSSSKYILLNNEMLNQKFEKNIKKKTIIIIIISGQVAVALIQK